MQTNPSSKQNIPVTWLLNLLSSFLLPKEGYESKSGCQAKYHNSSVEK